MGQYIKESKIWYIFRELLEGLQALHACNIVHRDIKSANVFLSKDGSVKLGDLNVSSCDKEGMMYTQTGTPYYCPPEIMKHDPYSSKCDIWSLGVVIFELTALEYPFKAKDVAGLKVKAEKGEYDKLPEHFSKELSDILALCMVPNPTLRYTAKMILEHK